MSLKGDLRFFPKEKNGLYIMYDRFSFDNFFRLLLKGDYDHEDALNFILSNCSLSALVWQERIHNKKYRKITTETIFSPMESARKARFIYDMLSILNRRGN